MENQFFCQTCQSKFAAEGHKREYKDPIFGACWERIAQCPTCKIESKEVQTQKPKKVNFDRFVSNLRTKKSCCCGNGGCC